MEQKARVELEVVQTGNAQEQLDRVATAAEKAAEAEKKLRDETAATNAEMARQQQTEPRRSARPQPTTAGPDRESRGRRDRGGPPDDEPRRKGAGEDKTFLERLFGNLIARGQSSPITQGLVGMFGKGQTGGMFGQAGDIGGTAGLGMGVWSAMTQAAKEATESIKVWGNAALSTSQKITGTIEQFVPGGKTLREFFEAASGISEKLRVTQVTVSDLNTQIQLQTQLRMRLNQLGQEAAQARGGEVGAASVGYGKWRTFDRGTASGAIQYQENLIRQSAEDDVVRATRRRNAALHARNAAVDPVNAAGIARSRAEWELQNRFGNVTTDSSGVLRFGKNDMGDKTRIQRLQEEQGTTMGSRRKAEMDEELRAYESQLSKVMALRKEEEAAINTLKEKGVALANSESEVRKASAINTLKAEAQILERREQRMSENQRRLGSLMPGELAAGESIMDQIRKNGIQGASPQMIQIARQVAPGEIDKLLEQKGAPIAKRLAEKGYEDYVHDYDGGKRTLTDTRQQLDKVQADVRVQVDLDEKALASEIAKAIGPLIQAIKELNVKTAEDELQKQRVGRTISLHMQY